MTQERCPALQHRAHGERTHDCVGDLGHAGPHWCLLGHTWTNEAEEAPA